MNKFFEVSNTEFSLISFESSYLIEHFQQLDLFIQSNFPEEYHHILAKPDRSSDKIEWYTEFSGTFKKVELMSPYDKEKFINIYNARKHEIDNKCNALAASEDYDKRAWAKILMSAFHPNHIQLFSNGQQIVLVWGINTQKAKDYYQGFENYSHLIIPVSPFFNDETIPTTDVNENKFVEPEVESKYFNENETEDSLEEESTSSNESEDIAQNDQSREERSIEDSTISQHNEIIYEDTDTPYSETIEDNDNLSPKESEPIHRQIKKKKPPFYTALDAFEIFAKRFWWLLLMLIAILLFFLFRGCENDNQARAQLTDEEIDEIYDEIMPQKPRVRLIPIDTTDFVQDGNGSIIVSGFLNIAMIDNKENFKKMSVDLKQAYPANDYQIVYFDDQTQRIQFGFPEKDNEKMANEIRSKLDKYELLIWNESIFGHTKTSNDPLFKDPEKSWHYNAIQLEKAWDITEGDTSVYIAVVDDGFDLSHDEFKGKRIMYPYNVTTGNSNVYGNAQIQHGTHVAALATGISNNNKGSSGVAPKCTFIPVQISSGEEYFTMTNIIDGILYAINHRADVINLSLGLFFGDDILQKSPGELETIINNEGKDQEKFWKSLFKLADEKNVTIVMAGGNQDLMIGLDPMQRSNATIRVVATDITGKKAHFSNYCLRCFDKEGFVSAPGLKIWSAVPGNGYQSMDGTSMASPIVAGAIGLLKSKRPNIKNKEILKLLKESSKKLNDRSCPPLLQIEALINK